MILLSSRKFVAKLFNRTIVEHAFTGQPKDQCFIDFCETQVEFALVRFVIADRSPRARSLNGTTSGGPEKNPYSESGVARGSFSLVRLCSKCRKNPPFFACFTGKVTQYLCS